MVRHLLHRAALVLALFAVGGQFFSVAHLLLVPHTVCAEHGELVHVEAQAGAERVAGRLDAAHAGYRAAGGADAADAHDHCLVSAVRREKVALAPARAAILPAASMQLAVTRASACVTPRARQILLFAPKSSPPALLA